MRAYTIKGNRAVGFTFAQVTIRGSQKSRKKYQAKFLVDTGATDCMAPASALERAGIRRRGKMEYELADGSAVEYDFGLAEIELLGEVTAGRVIFGPEGSEPLLGVTVLESLGYVVDPATERLKRLPAVRLKTLRRRPARYQLTPAHDHRYAESASCVPS